MNFVSFATDLQEMLQIEGPIQEDTPLNGQDWWDSMAFLYIITYADEQLHINIEYDDLKDAATIGDLYTILT